MSKRSEEIKKQLDEIFESGPDGPRQAIKVAQRVGQKFLSDAKYFEQYDLGKEMATDEKDLADGGLTMQFWLYGRPLEYTSNDWVCVPVFLPDWGPKDDATKQKIMRTIGARFTHDFPKHMLVNIVHLSEAWQAAVHVDAPEEDQKLARNTPPSKHPARQEVVIVSAVSLDHRISYFSAQIERNQNGRFVALGETMEDRHDPEHPALPHEGVMEDHLTNGIYAGYFKAKEKGDNNAETT